MYTTNALAVDGLKTMIIKNSKDKKRSKRDRFGDKKYGDLVTSIMREYQVNKMEDDFMEATGKVLPPINKD